MKKIIAGALAGVLMMCTVACGSDKEMHSDAPVQEGKTRYECDFGIIDLCDYKNLSLEKKIYTVTDERIEDAKINYLYDYSDIVDVDRAAKMGDIVGFAYIAYDADDNQIDQGTSEDGYEAELGALDFGSQDFDDNLVGASAGDTLDFVANYTEETDLFGVGNGIVSFHVDVLYVNEIVYPDLTKSFLKENYGVKSEEEFDQAIATVLASDYEYASLLELRKTALTNVINNSTVVKFADDFYEETKAAVEADYLSSFELFGYTTFEEIKNDFGFTDEDIEEEITSFMTRRLVVEALCKLENLTITDEEYQVGLANYITYMECETAEELFEEYDEESIRSFVQEDKICDFLIENATCTEVDATQDDYLYLYE